MAPSDAYGLCNEVILSASARGMRGGSYLTGDWLLSAGYWGSWAIPSVETSDLAFRVSEVPEPGTLSLLVLGGLALMRRRRK